MARLGMKTVNEMVGRTDLLRINEGIVPRKARGLDYSKILYKPEVPKSVATYCRIKQDHGIDTILDRKLMAGADIVWITPEAYDRRDELFEREATSLKKAGRKPYTIPEGASNALGAWGYIRCMEELVNDIASLPGGAHKDATIINATGSGGTSAGLILGARLFDLNAQIVSINVCDDQDYFVRVIRHICESAISEYHLEIDFSHDDDITIIDGYVGRGYALSRPEELSMMCDVARTEGIFLDPVYTGKAFFGMMQELERDPKCFGERIIFIHTGGIFGLFPKAREIEPLLS